MAARRIGRYEISAEIGRGSTGIVYKGVDPANGRVVAVKTLQRERPDDEAEVATILQRFRNEARAIGRLSHPGVVAVHEFGEDGLQSWIAMEYIDGHDLDEVLVRCPLLGEARTLAIVDQLLDALGCVHRHGICHRDVKPANIMLTAAGQVKLTDFGVARLRDVGLTQVSSVIGTPACMAPEQFTGAPVDQRADLFACGVLLYRLLSGRRPFSGGPAAVMHQILHAEPPPVSEASGGVVGSAYDGVLRRALAKQADDRFATAEEMRAALHEAARQARSAPVVAMDATLTHAGVRRAAPAPAPLPPSSPWDPEALATIERALAYHVGPLSRLILREAAERCDSIGDLGDALARHIPDERGRQAFLDRLRQLEAERGATRPADPGALTPACRTAALELLTRRLGPVARVLVRRAEETASGSRARFVADLLAQTPAADRPALQHDLDALPH